MRGKGGGEGGGKGEIGVRGETARRSARRLRLSERQETLRYVIHGALHLAGWDDQTAGERRRMRREEDRVLGGLSEPQVPARREDQVAKRPRHRDGARKSGPRLRA